MQSESYIKGTTIPANILGAASAMDRLADSGFYYLYSPGLPVHRVQQQDGCPHIYPNRIQGVNDHAKWYPQHLAADTGAVGTRTTRDLNGRSQQEVANAEYAGSIVASILDGETGWGRKAVVRLDSLSHLPPSKFDLDFFNDLICPFPIIYQRADPNARFDDVDPKLKKRLGEIPAIVMEDVGKRGALAVRRDFVLEAKRQLEAGALGVPADVTALYLAAISEILPSFDLFRAWASGMLDASDKAVRAASNGGAGKAMYDELDGELQWLLARVAVDAFITEQLNKPVAVNVTLPEGYGANSAPSPTLDIERQPCATCGELIAVTAKKCRYCNEAVVETKPKGRAPKSTGPEKVTDDPLI